MHCGDNTRLLLKTMPAEMIDDFISYLHRRVVEDDGTPWGEICVALSLDAQLAQAELAELFDV